MVLSYGDGEDGVLLLDVDEELLPSVYAVLLDPDYRLDDATVSRHQICVNSA